MDIGVDRAKIVDSHNLDVGALVLEDGTQDQPADPAKTVDRNTNSHRKTLIFSTVAAMHGIGRNHGLQARRNSRFFA
jgi:hypothetical protein